MSLIRRNHYDPFYGIDRMMSRTLDRMWPVLNDAEELVGHPNANLLAVDVTSDEDNVLVRTALPGFSEDEIDVKVQDNVLTISAESKTEREDKQANWHIREMRYGKFARSIRLPEEIATNKADAALENGILTVKLPKQKPSPVQKIAVKARELLKGK